MGTESKDFICLVTHNFILQLNITRYTDKGDDEQEYSRYFRPHAPVFINFPFSHKFQHVDLLRATKLRNFDNV